MITIPHIGSPELVSFAYRTNLYNNHNELNFNKYNWETKNLAIWNTHYDSKNFYKPINSSTFNYNVNIMNYVGNNINYLSKILGDISTIIFPYLNNLKSDIIGFTNYKYYIDPESILSYQNAIKEDDQILYFKRTYTKYKMLYLKYQNPDWKNFEDASANCIGWLCYENGYYNDIIEFIKTNYPQLLVYIFNILPIQCTSNIFVCNWKIYCELAEYIIKFLTFINDKYNLEWNENKWMNHIYSTYIKYNIDNYKKYSTLDGINHNEIELNWYNDTMNSLKLAYNNKIQEYTKREYSKYYKIYSVIIEMMISWFILSKNNIYAHD